jgi:dTDP-4-dehydrorhamnose reductase
MRVLVTGVTGQVGAAILARFAAFATLIAFDRKALDLADPTLIPSRLDAADPDVIINPAAFTAVDQAEDDRELAFTINARSPSVMAQWAAARGVPLVHFSTDYVFDGSGDRPWCEADMPNPLSAYGASKLAGEVAVRQTAGPHLVVRTSWVYAASGRNFLVTMARLATTQRELRVVSDQVGSPTSAGLIADGLAQILDADRATIAARFAAAGGVVHLTAAQATSWHGFAIAIVAGLKARGVVVKAERLVPIDSEGYPTKAIRPKNSRLDTTRLGRVFGISPPHWVTALDPELDLLAASLERA